jgi:hypothetical protein
MRTSVRLLAIGALAALFSGGSCTYAPNIDDSVLACGAAQACPKGYTCGVDSYCWKSGDEFLAGYVGTWTFVAGTLTANCTDSKPATRPLAGDPLTNADSLTIDPSPKGVVAGYYCNWTLHATGNGSSAALDTGPAQSCTQVSSDNLTGVSYTYTWSATQFSFSSSGQSASAMGRFGGPFDTSTGGSGTCDVTFNGTLAATP